MKSSDCVIFSAGTASTRRTAWHSRKPKRLAELAAFFGQLNGLAFPFVEAFGLGPVNRSADGTVKGRHGVPGTRGRH
jgi:hypothetical protein